MPRTPNSNPGVIARFFIRRRQRIVTWATLGMLVGSVAALEVQPNEIANQWSYVVAAEGDAYWTALTRFFFDALVPLAGLIAITAILFGAVTGAIGFVAASLPHRIGTLADGLALGSTLMVLMDLLQISPALRSIPHGRFLDLATIWLTMIALSGVVWNHLPWGLSYRDRSARVLPVPVSKARDRLIAHRVPDQPLADAAVGGHDPDMPADWQPVITRREGSHSYRVDEPASALPWRRMSYRLEEVQPGATRVEIEIELNALSPLAWWDVATRPYGEDFLDHIEARLCGRPDHSTYGRLANKLRNAALRRARRHLGTPLVTGQTP